MLRGLAPFRPDYELKYARIGRSLRFCGLPSVLRGGAGIKAKSTDAVPDVMPPRSLALCALVAARDLARGVAPEITEITEMIEVAMK